MKLICITKLCNILDVFIQTPFLLLDLAKIKIRRQNESIAGAKDIQKVSRVLWHLKVPILAVGATI